jgi:ribose transport system ATP-binding protein
VRSTDDVSHGTVGASTSLLLISHLSKTFGAQRALEDVDFEIRHGEIHALVGENGSGKSTLIKILSGFHQPDPDSAASFDGEEITLGHADASQQKRMVFVHQDRALIPTLSVLENLGLKRASGRALAPVRPTQERQLAHTLLSRFELRVPLDTPVNSLTPFDRSVVAIARAIGAVGGVAKLLVLDEPTAALGGEDRERLFSTLREINRDGVAILYVSHYLDEVLGLADRISVLRDGRRVATRDTAETSESELVRLIVGHDVAAVQVPPRPAASQAVTASVPLEVRRFTGGVSDDVSFRAGENEILGLTGLIGSGYQEISRFLAGATGGGVGAIVVDGNVVTRVTPRTLIEAGIVTMPADRLGDGLIAHLTVAENVTLPMIGKSWRSGWIHPRHLREDVMSWLVLTGVSRPDPARRVAELSGGNQQRVLFAKALRLAPRVLVVTEPTQAVDAGGTAAIRELIVESSREPGRAVVVASADAAELAEVCHRVLVFRNGAVRAELTGDKLTEDQILHASNFDGAWL